MPECHDCKYRDDPDRLERCLKCSPSDDGDPFHVGKNAVAYLDANPGAVDAIADRSRDGRTDTVTQLPEGVEDSLRAALATFAGLSPTDALLAHHILAVKPLATFRETMRKIACDVLRNDDLGQMRKKSDKSFAWTRARKLVKQFSPFASLMPERKGNKGGGKRPKRKTAYVQEELL